MDTTNIAHALMVAWPYGPRRELMNALEDGQCVLDMEHGLYYMICHNRNFYRLEEADAMTREWERIGKITVPNDYLESARTYLELVEEIDLDSLWSWSCGYGPYSVANFPLFYACGIQHGETLSRYITNGANPVETCETAASNWLTLAYGLEEQLFSASEKQPKYACAAD